MKDTPGVKLVLIVICIFLFAIYSSGAPKGKVSTPGSMYQLDESIVLQRNQQRQSNPQNLKILYVFISIGKHDNRNEIILKNINHLVKDEDCLVFAYTDQTRLPSIPQCRVIKLYKTRYIFFLKQVHPLLVREYDYVHFVLDDVVHYPPMGNFEKSYFDVLYRNQIGYGSPAIKGSYWTDKGLGPIDNQLGRRTKMIEIQATTFHYNLYKCFYELIDTETPSGWGIDLWFYEYCKEYMGPEMNGTAPVDDMNGMAIVDKYFIQHNPFGFESSHEGDGADMHRQVSNYNSWLGASLVETMPHDLELLT